MHLKILQYRLAFLYTWILLTSTNACLVWPSSELKHFSYLWNLIPANRSWIQRERSMCTIRASTVQEDYATSELFFRRDHVPCLAKCWKQVRTGWLYERMNDIEEKWFWHSRTSSGKFFWGRSLFMRIGSSCLSCKCNWLMTFCFMGHSDFSLILVMQNCVRFTAYNNQVLRLQS